MELSFLYENCAYGADYEIIERKGLGHPDTLADALAELLSRNYANYTLAHYGIVLHHNFDKVGLLGGRAHVQFGSGRLESPIRVLLNGRASESFGSDKIPVRDLLTQWTQEFIMSRFPRLDILRDILIHYNLSTGSSPGYISEGSAVPGARNHWFSPRNMKDVREHLRLCSNDTSVGCAHYPFSDTEQLVLRIEKTLTSPEYQRTRPWLGSDIKVMACRIGSELEITVCLPQIADFVPNADAYVKNLASSRADIEEWAREKLPNVNFKLHVNTKDDLNIPELYLTAIGSSIESGDEGLVGRGNRPNGLISMCRPYSMEGACGKNPVYHTGKIYNVVAQRISQGLCAAGSGPVAVWLIGQEGRALKDPWRVVVVHGVVDPSIMVWQSVIENGIANVEQCTADILAGKVVLY